MNDTMAEAATTKFNLSLDGARIAVVGLGYVGLPLAVALGREFPTLGYDIDAERVRQLEAGSDLTGEVDGTSVFVAWAITDARFL